MATEDYNIGWADATGNGWNPVDRRGPELEHYSKGFVDGCNRAKPHQLMPLDNFTIIRPEPTRAEMATAILCALYTGPYRNHIANHETFLEASEEAIAMTDAFRAALDRKETSR